MEDKNTRPESWKLSTMGHLQTQQGVIDEQDSTHYMQQTTTMV